MDYLVAGLFHPILFLNALKLLRKMISLMYNDTDLNLIWLHLDYA